MFLSPDCCRRVGNLIPMPRAFLLPTYWADDPVSGLQAVEHGVETFLVEAQAPLVLLNNRLLCNSTAQHPQGLPEHSHSCWAHTGWAGYELLTTFIPLGQVSTLRENTAANQFFSMAQMVSYFYSLISALETF